MDFTVDMVDCQETILREIAVPETSKRSVAMSYAFAMKSTEPIEWKKINEAIIARWGMTGLVNIKKSAISGKCFK